jgi:hypothetical protein
MGIARSTYYGPSQVLTDDIAIVEAIVAVCKECENHKQPIFSNLAKDMALSGPD